MLVSALLRSGWFYAGVFALLAALYGLHTLTVYLARADERRTVTAEWEGKLSAAVAAEQARQMSAILADYERGLAKGAELAKSGEADRVASTTTIERVIHESPSAEACRYDAAAALASNSLRQRPD
jgi:hypothetical protein